jgi:polyphosphate kinase
MASRIRRRRRVKQALIEQFIGLADSLAFRPARGATASNVVSSRSPLSMVSRGVTSNSNVLYFGINADRDAMSAVDLLPTLLRESHAGGENGFRSYDSLVSKNKSGKQLKKRKIPNEIYEAELLRLQTEFVRLQEWVRHTGARIVVVFEGRDAAGKGGTIKRITEYLSPRVARIAALPAPTDRERGQWYYQRYIAHLPAKGEIVLFDRSWYNRAGVELVMGFCTPQEHTLFLRQTPIFEQMLLEDGILLRKYWFSVSDDEQLRRFKCRLNDPVRQWKLSPMDLESVYRWEDYSRAKDQMMVYTDTPISPWYVVESDIKKHARLNMMSHLLSTIDYHYVEQPTVELPDRPVRSGSYQRPPRELSTYVDDFVATLMGERE